MKAQELIRELGQVLNLPKLAFDEANVCRVLFDGHAVDFETLHGKDTLYLIAEIGPITAGDPAACFRRLLDGNRYGLETGGATLAIDPDRASVIMHRQLDVAAMDYPMFEACLEVFFERLKYWKEAYNVPSTVLLSVDDSLGLLGQLRG